MKSLPAITTIFTSIFIALVLDNVYVSSIEPDPEKPLMCPMMYKFCEYNQYFGFLPNSCPDCHDCPVYNLTPCKDGSKPEISPKVRNECPTYSCLEDSEACTMEYKICPSGQYFGLAPNGCYDCMLCHVYKLDQCSDGSYPNQNPLVENQCPTFSCGNPQQCIGKQCLAASELKEESIQ